MNHTAVGKIYLLCEYNYDHFEFCKMIAASTDRAVLDRMAGEISAKKRCAIYTDEMRKSMDLLGDGRTHLHVSTFDDVAWE